MSRRSLSVAATALAVTSLTAGPAVAAVAGPAVHVQIRNQSHVLRQVTVHGERGWITRGGTPRGKCSGDSAAGALNAATHGRWSGKYYASVGGIFVTSILGDKPKGSDYWAFLVNGRTSSLGVCSVRLHPGEHLEFKIVK
jgi:hypothetical protein